MNYDDTRLVVGIDFGTTYSGFAYANKINPEIITNDTWTDQIGQLKTNTVLQYDENFYQVEAWGCPALAKRQKRKDRSNPPKPIELFKLHLGDIPKENKPVLPPGLSYKRAITDYLREIDTVTTRWPNINFMSQVKIVVTVPAEFSEKSKSIMRECIFNAGLISDLHTVRLQFTTEPEAAAIYCMRTLAEHFDNPIGMVSENKLGEITERTGDFCGSAYVDQEFIKFLETKVGESAIELLRKNNYNQFQYMIQEFCKHVKLLFSGEKTSYKPYEFDLEEVCPVLKQYVTGTFRDNLEEEDWMFELTFKNVKDMFDPVLSKIISLIKDQLGSSKDKCTAMFLVGGFSESKYLQFKVKQEFKSQVSIISVPRQPIAAIVRGAVDYGLNAKVIKSRVLKYTYGTKTSPLWTSADPKSRKRPDGRIFKFFTLAEKGKRVDVDEEVSHSFSVARPEQTSMDMDIYVTRNGSAKFCDEDDVVLLGNFSVAMPELGLKRSVLYTLRFGEMEIRATAKNKQSGKEYHTSFKLEFD
ncbi:10848_t:CDS:2 [Funneliformis geosporum]|uniref:18157_t:CDS:1 n=1 Tax=Funneliformis geosporum TaxID=1117311 RepID=A0A9W4WLS3_9GLOM|nr:10848_t:CDS:2 [Funneliformis geosporum]CAI2163384.1 18157_t:CDS:2 [Funneliformis geosporum]